MQRQLQAQLVDLAVEPLSRSEREREKREKREKREREIGSLQSERALGLFLQRVWISKKYGLYMTSCCNTCLAAGAIYDCILHTEHKFTH